MREPSRCHDQFKGEGKAQIFGEWQNVGLNVPWGRTGFSAGNRNSIEPPQTDLCVYRQEWFCIPVSYLQLEGCKSFLGIQNLKNQRILLYISLSRPVVGKPWFSVHWSRQSRAFWNTNFPLHYLVHFSRQRLNLLWPKVGPLNKYLL